MTQRVFDPDNEQDMKDLFHPLNEIVQKIMYFEGEVRFLDKDGNYISRTDLIRIKCSSGTIINRPIQEATEEDIGKLCKFWDDDSFETFNILQKISTERGDYRYQTKQNTLYKHCRRLTKQEIEELC